jgi:hypothetical protein
LSPSLCFSSGSRSFRFSLLLGSKLSFSLVLLSNKAGAFFFFFS